MATVTTAETAARRRLAWRPRDLDMPARIGLCVMVLVGFSIAIPNFLAVQNAWAIMQVVAPIGLTGLGIGVTMLAGEVDLSIGSMAVVGGVVSVEMAGHGAIAAIVIPALIGLVIGAVHGIVISKLAISSLVLTIGTLILLSGISYLLAHEESVSVRDFGIGAALNTHVWILSPLSLIFLVIVAVLWAVLRSTKYGHEIYAIGGGRREAQAAGVRTLRPLVLAFSFSGTMGALTGALMSQSTGGATPTGFGGVLLNSIAAAVIGGVALSGGRGSPWGVALGALALGVVSNGVNVLGAQSFVFQFLIGGLLLAALVAEMLTTRARRRQAGRIVPRSHPQSKQESAS
ncbi:ABC transporter permease [Streptomyces griseoluteus]|uniref:ABC transporter permease n=1 Tax=Streptomyces griseoluteus TaxID=29306 RepID=UPI00367D1C66